jgi:hypothetical protein
LIFEFGKNFEIWAFGNEDLLLREQLGAARHQVPYGLRLLGAELR